MSASWNPTWGDKTIVCVNVLGVCEMPVERGHRGAPAVHIRRPFGTLTENDLVVTGIGVDEDLDACCRKTVGNQIRAAYVNVKICGSGNVLEGPLPTCRSGHHANVHNANGLSCAARDHERTTKENLPNSPLFQRFVGRPDGRANSTYLHGSRCHAPVARTRARIAGNPRRLRLPGADPPAP